MILSVGVATLDETRAAQPTTGPESEAARESTTRGRDLTQSDPEALFWSLSIQRLTQILNQQY